MATVVITPEMQRANAEALLGRDPGKYRDPGQRWTAKRYAEIQRLLKQTEADTPVTILNLNPFPLKINGGVYFPDQVPACLPGEPYATYVIKQTRWGHRDLGCDSQNMMQMEPVPAIPLVLAAEYIREFVQQEGGFGGVLCYVGTHHPGSFKKGAKIRVPEVAYNEQGEFYVEVRERDFHEALAAVRQKRNDSLLRRLQSANAWHENDSQRMNVNDAHRDMARLAFHEGLIPELPRWVMQSSTLMEKQPEPCPSCASQPKTGAILCVNCGHIFDVLAAYRNARIAYGAVEMDRLTAEEWKIVHQIKAERDKAKGKAGSMSWTLGQVKARVRALLDDPQGSYLTDDFIVPLIAEVYDDANSQLASTQSSYDIAVTEVAGVAPGTPNLAALQTGAGPLAHLAAQPLRIDWKAAGEDPSYYRLIPNYGVLPDLVPQEGVAGWEFRSNTIWLTPSSIAVDLRVRGEFGPAPLTNDASVLTTHPRIGYVVSYGTAALIAAVRGNGPWMEEYEQKAAEGMDEIMEQLVRGEQGQVRRTGRQTRNRC